MLRISYLMLYDLPRKNLPDTCILCNALIPITKKRYPGICETHHTIVDDIHSHSIFEFFVGTFLATLCNFLYSLTWLSVVLLIGMTPFLVWLGRDAYQKMKRARSAVHPHLQIEFRWGFKCDEYWIINNPTWIETFTQYQNLYPWTLSQNTQDHDVFSKKSLFSWYIRNHTSIIILLGFSSILSFILFLNSLPFFQ
jgi:hypothetical protein